MHEKKIIMGIDPGTRVTGYGIIETGNRLQAIDFGCIRPPTKEELNKRYLVIFNGIETLIQKYKPDVIAIETQFVRKNVQSALKLGMARGIVIVAAGRYNIPLFEYSPRKAKLAATGCGAASKFQIQKMLQMLLSLQNLPSPEDAADALAIAICHAHQQPYLSKIKDSHHV